MLPADIVEAGMVFAGGPDEVARPHSSLARAPRPLAADPADGRRWHASVHRATIAVAIAEEEGPPSSYGTIANEPATVRKLMRQLGGKDVELRAKKPPLYAPKGH